ncbi:MAG: RNA polymerase sigma factor [Pirellulales bacterium]
MADRRPEKDIVRLVSDHHAAVYRYAYRLTGTVADAEDLAQQVFLTAQEKIDQLRRPDSARSWLLAITRRRFLKEVRRRRPEPAADVNLDLGSVPNEPFEDHANWERLQEAVDQLPEKFRVVLMMFYFEEASYRQIAEALQVPPGTVMSRLARAKSHIRAMLMPSGEEEPSDELPRQAATIQHR